MRLVFCRYKDFVLSHALCILKNSTVLQRLYKYIGYIFTKYKVFGFNRQSVVRLLIIFSTQIGKKSIIISKNNAKNKIDFIYN